MTEKQDYGGFYAFTIQWHYLPQVFTTGATGIQYCQVRFLPKTPSKIWILIPPPFSSISPPSISGFDKRERVKRKECTGICSMWLDLLLELLSQTPTASPLGEEHFPGSSGQLFSKDQRFSTDWSLPSPLECWVCQLGFPFSSFLGLWWSSHPFGSSFPFFQGSHLLDLSSPFL